jgi:hypothetical protein
MSLQIDYPRPTKDWPLLWKTFNHIVDHPEEWDQTEYAKKTTWCGTACCFAGLAVLIGEPQAQFYWGPKGREVDVAAVCFFNEEKRTIASVAEEILGLNPWEAHILFDAGNSLEKITRILRAWEAADG